MKNSEVVITSKNGHEEVIKILKYFKFKNSNNKYIIYTSNANKSSSITIFAAIIVETKDEIRLESIQDKKILHKIDEIIKREKDIWMK